MARGYAPVAAVLLLAVTVVAAGTVLVFLPSVPGEPPPKRAVAVDAAADGRVELTLVSGPAIDVRDLEATVSVDGTRLADQPPVPFFAAAGFVSGPTGPFNVADDPTWTVGETATFQVADTNEPAVAAGAELRVALRVRGRVVAVVQTTVGDA
ncbi:MAG: type IV pilin [Halobacterium sp.]